MKIATWNVNSLKVRLPQVLAWLATHQPDLLCLQETKLEDKNFPTDAIEAAGYRAVSSGQKTYNGVAILAREPLQEVVRGIDGFDDAQQRVISATLPTPAGPLRIVCAYVPNGQSIDSDKYRYKLDWLAALTGWLRAELQQHPRLVLAGDFNIAPEDRDVHDPEAWKDQVLCSAPERAAFRELLALGMVDAFRRFEQPENSYSWWDYRMMAFRRNRGLRIDLILLSGVLAESCTACGIDKEARRAERPSDHAPVGCELI
ncbi:exodeoxyribonuclease III [mine drainage metagenome]|uniref:Exodeoxyribonuclease III n=1 Tax=mine drainage metagenome TaxID=410659 RepID=A0A1J5R521_9ZZZZ